MSELKPAMTPEQWREQLMDWEGNAWPQYPLSPDKKEELYDRPHAMAAMALYGQSFGFTRDDVDAIRAAADMLVSSCEEATERVSAEIEAAELRSIAERIEALLAPDELVKKIAGQ